MNGVGPSAGSLSHCAHKVQARLREGGRVRVSAVVLALLLAGCSAQEPSKDSSPDDATKGDPLLPAPESFDRISEHLPANSTAWQEFLVIEDEVELVNGSMQFTTGRGMGCQGDADNVSAGSVG